MAFLLWTAVTVPPLFGLELSRAETGAGIHPEYSRSLHYSWDIFAFGLVELNRVLSFGGGAAAGQIWDQADLDLYLFTEYALPFFRTIVPLNLRFTYIYNGIPGYETRVHTLLPLASLNWRWFGFALGRTFRFTRFAGDPALYEPITAYSLHAVMLDTGEARAELGVANYDDFSSRNLGTFLVTVKSRVRIDPRLSLFNELSIDLSGNSGGLTSVHGISIREGVVIQWGQ
ncbi:MAG: hypothetical protein LBD09_02190 [Treponema sp.]|nr:hypothetical protein [Treponema sp.]